MSDATEQEDKDLEIMRQQIEAQEAKEKAQAAPVVEPQPEVTEPVIEAQAQTVEAVTPTQAQETPGADDPMEWAKKKGLNSPESMARSLQSLEDEFHRRNQAGHPGYRDLNGNQAPPPPPPQNNWQPQPVVPQWGYPPANGYAPPPMTKEELNRQLSQESGIDPDDINRLMPLIVKVSKAVSASDNARLQSEMLEIRKQAARNSEFVQLSQDPAFADARVQKEMHEVLKDGSVFQRSGSPYVAAFQIALANLARKQLQGSTQEQAHRNLPPTTAHGGNGSANTAPPKITEELVESWTPAQQDAFFKSNGKIIPRK